MPDGDAKPRYAVGPTLLMAVGAVCAGVVLVKGVVIGYYDSDLPWMVITALVGAACLWIAAKWAERS